MSLFIDVTEALSSIMKKNFLGAIESQRKNQDRPIRRICDTCSKYLDYGELRYDRMEDGISELQKTGLSGNDLNLLLYAILHESLDEDQTAIQQLIKFSDSSLAEPFRSELSDFIALGSVLTLQEYDKLENAVSIIIDRYSNEEDITDIISNLWLRIEKEEYFPVFQRMLARAKELYPSGTPLESLNGYINYKGKDYQRALESFLVVKDRLEQDRDNTLVDHNLAYTWDNIAGCYLKLGDADKTIESCDIAINYDMKSEEFKIGASVLYKKAEAFILTGQNDQALAIVNQLLEENKEDKQALEIKNRITAG